jgi:hypothetical protein
MANRQLNLSLELAGLKSGEVVQFTLMQHWVSLKGRVSEDSWQKAFQPNWKKDIENCNLLIPGIEKFFPTTKEINLKTAKNTEKAHGLSISFNGAEKVWPLSEVEFVKVASPISFRNHQVQTSTQFFDNKDRFLVSSSSLQSTGYFVALHKPTGTHMILNFKEIKLVFNE